VLVDEGRRGECVPGECIIEMCTGVANEVLACAEEMLPKLFPRGVEFRDVRAAILTLAPNSAVASILELRVGEAELERLLGLFCRGAATGASLGIV